MPGSVRIPYRTQFLKRCRVTSTEVVAVPTYRERLMSEDATTRSGKIHQVHHGRRYFMEGVVGLRGFRTVIVVNFCLKSVVFRVSVPCRDAVASAICHINCT